MAFRRVRFPRCLPVLLLTVVLSGCGPGYKLVPVSGKVTLDGKPLPEVLLTFQPVAPSKENPHPGPGSVGTTDSEGRFRLHTVDRKRNGAVPGTHHVYFALADQEAESSQDDAGGTVDHPFPPEGRDGSMTFSVPPEGTDAADFDLISPK